MKKLYIFALVAAMFAACATDAIDEQSVKVEEQTPDTLVGTFEGDNSRIQLENGKTVWTEGDLVSVFYRSNANQKWQYQGKTGERSGTIKRVANAEATQELSDIVVVYPYNENYYINPRTYNVQAFLPAEQTYLANSYGLDGNIMISASEYKNFALKNVCGWLKIQLTGTSSQKVSSITLKGNNGEQVAGEIYINSADASCELASKSGVLGDDFEVGGTIFEDGTVLTSVTLNCGEGVALGSTAKSFYIALPPQTFEKGFSLEIVATDGSTMTKSTENKVEIERNHILPMAEFGYEGVKPKPANNEIWYTSSDGKVVEPYSTTVFGANIVSNEYKDGKGVITFDGPVTSIGYQAFRSCISLTSVTIPDSVTSIGSEAFGYCSSLTSVTIGNSVTKIESGTFYGCGSLTSVTIPDRVTSIGKSAFYQCSSLTSITIPDSVTSIGDYAFSDCSNLTSITIPDSVTSIGRDAFKDCTSLTSITIPNSVTSIEYMTFHGCSSLTSITIPNSVTSIGSDAFEGCRSLTSVTIPDRVTSIRNDAFALCSSLTSVYCKPITPPTGGTYMFNRNASGRKIYVPAGSVEAYKSASYWSSYASDIEGYDF